MDGRAWGDELAENQALLAAAGVLRDEITESQRRSIHSALAAHTPLTSDQAHVATGMVLVVLGMEEHQDTPPETPQAAQERPAGLGAPTGEGGEGSEGQGGAGRRYLRHVREATANPLLIDAVRQVEAEGDTELSRG